MTPKENMYAVFNWEKPEYIPLAFEAYHICRMPTASVDQAYSGGKDGFGITWEATQDGATPTPGMVVFDDIADWREHVVFPDIDKLDFHAMAEQELKGVDRNEKVIDVISTTGCFERLVAYMGFENALCALLEDPEACADYVHAMTDFRIKFFQKVIDAYHPDVVTYFDDVATSRGLFFSPAIYREIFLPDLKRLIASVSSRGVLFAQHCCGKCEDIVGDYVEAGAKIWSSAQCCNDIAAIKEKYRGRLVVEGGWDTTGPCSFRDGTVEAAVEEAKRCIREYGSDGGFIMQITLLNAEGNSLRVGDARLDEIKRVWKDIASY